MLKVTSCNNKIPKFILLNLPFLFLTWTLITKALSATYSGALKLLLDIETWKAPFEIRLI